MKRLAIYAHHDGKGKINDDDICCLEDLLTIFDTVLIVATDTITTEVREKIGRIERASLLVRKSNVSGLLAYKAGLEHYGYDAISGLDELLLTDNPCRGPVHPYSRLWAIMKDINCNFWSIAKFFQKDRDETNTPNMPDDQGTSFLNGFWLVFRGQLLKSRDFRTYWDRLDNSDVEQKSPEEWEDKVVAFFLGFGYTAWEFDTPERMEQRDPLAVQEARRNIRILRRRYLRYKILSKIAFGWRRDHYARKRKTIKSEMSFCRACINQKGRAIVRAPRTIEFHSIANEGPSPAVVKKPAVRAIAFYLPQFHTFPENDAWWGKGFTEWTNVKKAVPLFPGHYHPKEPAILGYYDLTDIHVMKKQAEMAKAFGLHGFCFHYYWFAGKRLMERPLEAYLADGSVDFPFCLNWANENWTRRWDGQENQILIKQEHSEMDDRAIMRDVIRYFRDPRYIRINDRPIFLVYRPILFPDMRQTLERWRDECDKAGIGTPYFIMCQTFHDIDPAAYGFDAAVQFPPHPPALEHYYPHAAHPAGLTPDFQGCIFSYDEVTEFTAHCYEPGFPSFPCIFPEWDNTARRKVNANVFLGCTPDLYAKWLVKVGREVVRHFPRDRRFLFINAWNEWAEGAYLEPDAKNGYAYLNATSRALAKLQDESADSIDGKS